MCSDFCVSVTFLAEMNPQKILAEIKDHCHPLDESWLHTSKLVFKYRQLVTVNLQKLFCQFSRIWKSRTLN